MLRMIDLDCDPTDYMKQFVDLTEKPEEEHFVKEATAELDRKYPRKMVELHTEDRAQVRPPAVISLSFCAHFPHGARQLRV